ncbi:MAG: diguanylate cyclase [Candidatus Methylomirabilis sp.]|nr:diguanylate cyclase [Deltaproteobacteria bacterium]
MGVDTLTIERTNSNKVLIIDDNLVNKAAIEDVLAENGFETRAAADGKEGLRILHEWVPNVILLDLVMPGMDGMSVCREIRRMNISPRPSIIIISVKDDKESIVSALTNGADDFIVKPLNGAELVARVKAQKRICEFYRELEEDKKNLETLLDITTAMAATLDASEILSTIVDKVAATTNAVRCSIVLISTHENEGYVLASHEDPQVKELKIDLSKYPEIKQVMTSKMPLALEDVLGNPIMSPVRDSIKDLEGMSILILPIVFHDEVLGTLFLRTRKKKNGFTQKEIDFCRIVANASFHALRNARLFEKVVKEKDVLKEMAVRDHLTNLYNHNFFYSRLEEEFERAVRYETPLSLIMVDIDNFKSINDTYGHRVGDMVLKEIAALIKKGVRKTDVVARYGGEEFSVILPHTLLKGAVDEAERLREMIEAHAYAGLVNQRITVSIGVASYPQKGAMNSGDLVNHADDALYKAKWSGKNCVKVAEV